MANDVRREGEELTIAVELLHGLRSGVHARRWWYNRTRTWTTADWSVLKWRRRDIRRLRGVGRDIRRFRGIGKTFSGFVAWEETFGGFVACEETFGGFTSRWLRE
eukprot:6518921-Prymnesium_polylepis.4